MITLSQAAVRRSVAVCVAWFAMPLAGALAQNPQAIRTVYVEDAGSAGSANAALRQRVIERIDKQGRIHVVPAKEGADAVLRVSTVIWPSGQYVPDAHSRSVVVTNYQGYASGILSDPTGQPLWSYMVTPGRFHFAGTLDNLADELEANLAMALSKGLSTAADSPDAAKAGTSARLRIGGATFPAPLYQRWLQSYTQSTGTAAASYQAVGSVEGLRLLAEGKVDLAASDIPAQASDAVDGGSSGADATRVPTVVGGVVPIYNLPGVTQGLNLTGEVLAAIYAGTIKRWNDPRLRALNRSVNLPDAAIAVVHRSDGSGTTFVWTSYLATANAEWKARIGPVTDWPVGVGAAGNEGVASKVAGTPNAIGYAEMTYAIQHRLNYASVKNPAGAFVHADLRTLMEATQRAKIDGSNWSLLNEPGHDSYPIATYTYLVAQPKMLSAEQRSAVAGVLGWMLTAGQKECSELGYAPLPRSVVETERAALKSLK